MRKDIENKTIEINNMVMEYVSFGTGKNNLIIIPGLGDSFNSVHGSGNLLYKQFKLFTSHFTVYAFSRPNNLPMGYTTRNMAEDLYHAINILALDNLNMIGFSQGGMISQYFAIDYPQSLKKLAIVVSLSRPNHTSKKVFRQWYNMAIDGDYRNLIKDTVQKSISSACSRFLKLLPLSLGFYKKPTSLKSFIIQSKACLTHDSYDEVSKINIPTLVIGGKKDKIVGKYAAMELSQAIPGSTLKDYETMGHDPLNKKEVMKDLYDFFIR